MSEVELKPCPFCGEDGHLCKLNDNTYSVVCENNECFLNYASEILIVSSEKEAIKIWNERNETKTAPTEPISVCDNCPHMDEYNRLVEKLEAKNNDLARQLIDHNKHYHDDHNTVPYLKYEIDTLKAKISTLEAEAEKLKGEIASLETNNEWRKDLLEDYEDRIAHFEQLLGRYYERDVARDKGRLQRAREYFEEALERHNGGA